MIMCMGIKKEAEKQKMYLKFKISRIYMKNKITSIHK
jgi:hypothetical protein